MQFKQYPSYKNSGVEWLGDVPEHWYIFKSNKIFKQSNVRSYESDEQLTASQKYGVIPQSLYMKKEESKVVLALSGIDNFKHVDKNDFVISLRSFQGGIELCFYDGCVSPAYTVLKPNKVINYSFWSYLFKSTIYISVLNTAVDGIREGKTISYTNFGKIYINIPPLSEQAQIANYLDTETTRIDNLIAKQEKLIELLEEQRKSIISHAVTKGLNPDAPMKDSGVEWLGDVPEHWEIYPISYSFNLLKNNNVGDDWEHTQLLSLTLQGVIKKDINEAKGKTHSDYSTYQKVNVGDFIFCLFDIEETPRTVGVVETSGMITSAYTALKPKPFINPKYFYYLFECRDDLKAFGSEYSGLRKTIRPTKFIKLKICYPKLNEQCEIVGFLDTKCKKIDLLISKQQQLIKKLKEYRSTIISHAVTGKIDVREFGA